MMDPSGSYPSSGSSSSGTSSSSSSSSGLTKPRASLVSTDLPTLKAQDVERPPPLVADRLNVVGSTKPGYFPNTKASQDPKEAKKLEIAEEVHIQDAAKPVLRHPPTIDQIAKMHVKTNQEGYRSKKIFEQESKLSYAIPVGNLKKQSNTNIDLETVNEFKFKFRSGRQPDAPSHIPTDQLFCLMGTNDLSKIKTNTKIFGDSNGANGHNGWARRDLYYTTYTSSF